MMAKILRYSKNNNIFQGKDLMICQRMFNQLNISFKEVLGTSPTASMPQYLLYKSVGFCLRQSFIINPWEKSRISCLNLAELLDKKVSIFQSWNEHFCTKRHDIQSQRRLVGQQPQLLTTKTMTVTPLNQSSVVRRKARLGFGIRNLERFASEFLVKYPLVEGIFF